MARSAHARSQREKSVTVFRLSPAADHRMGPLRPRRHRVQPALLRTVRRQSWLLFEAALGVKQQELAATYGIVGIALVDAKANFLKPVQVRRQNRDRLARRRIPPLQFRCRAQVQRRRRSGGRRRPKRGSGRCATKTERGQDQNSGNSKRRDRQFWLIRRSSRIRNRPACCLFRPSAAQSSWRTCRFELRLHQALDEVLITIRGQEFGRAGASTPHAEALPSTSALVLRKFADVSMEGDVRQLDLEGDADLGDHLVPARHAVVAVDDVVVAQPHVQRRERRRILVLDLAVDRRSTG